MAFSESSGSNGIMFAGDGPVMSGTWQNPTTGHKFTVQDSFFQDGQLMVQTTNGQVLDYNTIQNYIQCTDDKGNSINIPTQTPRTGNTQPESIPAEVSNMVLPEGPSGAGEDEFLTAEDMELTRGLGSITQPATMTNDGVRVNPEFTPTQETPRSEDYKMIDRVLRKHSIPELNAEILWNDTPKKQIETLVDILGVDPEEIAAYYIAKLDKNAVFEAMKNGVEKYINEIILATNPTLPPIKRPEIIVVQEEVMEEKQEKKPKKKSSKKK